MNNNETLKKLHSVEVEILDEIVRVCEKNNINYFLCGGTLLGAIRHKGFIPWDDDMDIAMFREDYNKFIEIAPKELNKKYCLDCYQTNKNCYFPFLKVRKNNTLLDEALVSHLDTNKGIFVDIFPLEKIENPYSKKLRIDALLIKNIWDVILYKYKIVKDIKGCRHPFLARLLNIYSLDKLKQKQLKLLEKQNNSEATTVCSLIGAYDYRKEIYDLKELIPASEVTFENKKYKTFKNYDYYLTKLYGNYMELPPKDKRVNHMPKQIIFDLKSKNKQ